jgi:hypothetical protein
MEAMILVPQDFGCGISRFWRHKYGILTPISSFVDTVFCTIPFTQIRSTPECSIYKLYSVRHELSKSVIRYVLVTGLGYFLILIRKSENLHQHNGIDTYVPRWIVRQTT